jgi:hypothetical protein
MNSIWGKELDKHQVSSYPIPPACDDEFALDGVACGYAQILLEGAGFIVWARVCLRGS